MKVDLEFSAKQLVVENLPLACSELIRYQSGNGISDDSVLHRIYGICCGYMPEEDAIEETYRLISQAAVCAMAGSGTIPAHEINEKMRSGLNMALQGPRIIQ